MKIICDWDNCKEIGAVSYTHLRAHETDSYLVCRLLLEKRVIGSKVGFWGVERGWRRM